MRALPDTSYLFGFMDRPGMLPDSERRASGAPDRNELAGVVAGPRLASMCARRNREDSIA